VKYKADGGKGEKLRTLLTIWNRYVQPLLAKGRNRYRFIGRTCKDHSKQYTQQSRML